MGRNPTGTFSHSKGIMDITYSFHRKAEGPEELEILLFLMSGQQGQSQQVKAPNRFPPLSSRSSPARGAQATALALAGICHLSQQKKK